MVCVDVVCVSVCVEVVIVVAAVAVAGRGGENERIFLRDNIRIMCHVGDDKG